MNTINFEGFESLKDFREFVEQIPDNQFCKWVTGDKHGNMCIIGHVNKLLHGHHTYRKRNNTPWMYETDFEESTASEIFKSIGIDAYKLAEMNNSGGSPKVNVLRYIDKKMAENNIF